LLLVVAAEVLRAVVVEKMVSQVGQGVVADAQIQTESPVLAVKVFLGKAT
jgi:hypothetical protein